LEARDLSVLVTGASSGIGRAVALEFARRGADLILCARRLERLRELRDEIERSGRRALCASCDVTRPEQVEAAVAAGREAFGALHVVVANAGFGVIGKFESLSVEDYRRQFETNVFGVLHTLKAALPELRKTGGRAAIIGSVSGYISPPAISPYSMSKYAVKAFADALYYETRGSGVSVTLISPGFVVSDIRKVDNEGRHHPDAPDPVPRWLRMPADRAARKIVRAILRRRRELILTGHGKAIVWVQRHVPALASLLIGWGVGRPAPRLERSGAQKLPDLERKPKNSG